MSWVASDPTAFKGQSVGSCQCVAFVEEAAHTPTTANWKRGKRVRDNNVPSGTAIATFDADGTYGNHVDGRSHAAIYVVGQADGLLVWDQWKTPDDTHPVSQRVIQFRGGVGEPVNDGDQFYVIEPASGSSSTEPI